MEITFKQIEYTEKDKVMHLFKKAAEKISKMNIDHWQYWKNPPMEKIRWVEDGIKNNEFFFIEFTEGEIIGMLRILKEDLLYWGKQKEKAIYLHSLVIIEEYGGKGIGSKVIEKVEKEAKEDGYNFLRLDSDSKNPKLCSYYEKHGFVKVGSKKLPLSVYNLYEKELK